MNKSKIRSFFLKHDMWKWCYSRVANKLFILCLAFCVIVPLVSWLLSALGYSVGNLISAEGLRWLLHHGHETLLFRLFPLFVLACIALDSLLLMFCRKYWLKFAVSLCVIWVVLLAFVLWSESPLRGVDGGLCPSPFVHALPQLICLSVIASSLLATPQWILPALVESLRRYAVLIVFYLVICCLYSEIVYVWP
ncbi:MAG: hypothetical protein LUC44_04500 [Prevotellaceae bacterium]|nr:hypothetical protein [Prevotellaceae bacterium]